LNARGDNVKAIQRSILGACVAFLLTGCGGEPSGENIKSALEQQMTDASKGVEALVGRDLAVGLQIKVHAVNKVACKESSDKPGYRCDFEAVIEYPLIGQVKENGSARFVKSDSGWRAYGE